MKIAVFGYYNALNAGDDRMQSALSEILNGHTLVFFPHNLGFPPKSYLRTFDLILIGGGGLVFARVGIWKNFRRTLRRLGKPFGIIGLGANSLDEGVRQDLLWAADHATFFFVRDSASKARLNSHERVEVFCDITWTLPYEHNQARGVGTDIALNLAPCHWRIFEPNSWVSALADYSLRPFPLNFRSGQDFDLLSELLDERPRPEFDIGTLKTARILVACRYHAIVFAMQIGIPFMAIQYDKKVEDLLIEANLQEIGLHTHEHQRAAETVKYVLSTQASIMDRIDQFADIQLDQARSLRKRVRDALS